MTTTTPDTVGITTADPPRHSVRLRFFVAFLVGLLLAMAGGVGALYAYDQQYIGRVLPGVRVGDVDLSGLDAAAARRAVANRLPVMGRGRARPDRPGGRSFHLVRGHRPRAGRRGDGRRGHGRGPRRQRRRSGDRRRAHRDPRRHARSASHLRPGCPRRGHRGLRGLPRARAEGRLGRDRRQDQVRGRARRGWPARGRGGAGGGRPGRPGRAGRPGQPDLRGAGPGRPGGHHDGRGDQCQEGCGAHRGPHHDRRRRRHAGHHDHPHPVVADLRPDTGWRLRRGHRHQRSPRDPQEAGQEDRPGAHQRLVQDVGRQDHRSDRQPDRLQDGHRRDRPSRSRP